METVGKCIGMDEEQWKDFQMLEDLECIVKTKKSFKPLKLMKIPLDEVKKKYPYDMPENSPFPYFQALKSIQKMDTITKIADMVKLSDELFSICRNSPEFMEYILRRYLLNTHRSVQTGSMDTSPKLLEALIMNSAYFSQEKTVYRYMTFLFQVREGQTVPESEVTQLFEGIKSTSETFRKRYLESVNDAMKRIFMRYAVSKDETHLVDDNFYLIYNDVIWKNIQKGIEGDLKLSDIKRGNEFLSEYYEGDLDDKRRINSIARAFLDNISQAA